MQHPVRILARVIFLIATTGTAFAAAPNDIESCDQSKDRELRLTACSRLIADITQSAAVRAVAYNNRGNVSRARGANEEAIADYDEAIKLVQHGTYFYNRGNAYRGKGDGNHAIADYSEAIRLNWKDADAYTNRGNLYAEQGDYDRAIFDYNMALQLKPGARVLYNRAEVYRSIGNQARAIADYSEALKSYPDSPLYHFGRGLAHLYSGGLADAQADLTRAAELKPQHPYGALWREIADRRNGAASQLARAASRLDMDTWPAPIIRLFLGEMTDEAVLQAADGADTQVREVRTCEALFYIGELKVLQKGVDQAAELFRRVANECRVAVVERQAARAELKLLASRP